jgi:dihydrofolate reductase
MLALIAAVADNMVIGDKGKLPWLLPADLKRFREITSGKTVIMGRNTYESIVGYRGGPLPDRQNIVLTSNQGFHAKGVEVASNMGQAIKQAMNEDVFIIGGSRAFEEGLGLADVLYLTEVHANIDGDVHFPDFDKSLWEEIAREPHQADEKNQYDYDFVTYRRKRDTGYNLGVARSVAQRQQMHELASRGICNFCQKYIRTEQKYPIELETEHWVVKKNDYPYERTSLHLMIIPKRHIKTFSELNLAEQADFGVIIARAESQWKLTSYALGMRSGDMHYNGGSVEHLHAHIVVGDINDPSHEPVRFKMSSRPKA